MAELLLLLVLIAAGAFALTERRRLRSLVGSLQGADEQARSGPSAPFGSLRIAGPIALVARRLAPVVSRLFIAWAEGRAALGGVTTPRGSDAIYRRGRLVPVQPLALPEGARVRIVVGPPWGTLGDLWALAWQIARAAFRVASLEAVLFGGVLLVYLATRLWGIEDYPIYFFTDEARQALIAEDLLVHGLRHRGEFLPIYFEGAPDRWMPLLPIYAYLLPVALFGKSIFVVRATSAVLSLLVPIAASLALKLVFKSRLWWLPPLLFAVTPAWFLHSRTAFESVSAVAGFACFALAYLLYRCRSPRFLYVAIAVGAATFYSHSGAQIMMLVTGGLLFLIDLPYHLRHVPILLRGAALAAPLALPFVTFNLVRPEAQLDHLYAIHSYLAQPIGLLEKVMRFVQTYSQSLSPGFWFLSLEPLERHRMDGYGPLPVFLLPLLVAGVVLAVRRWSEPGYRVLLGITLAAPVGSALHEVGVLRSLPFVVPAVVLAVLGLEFLLSAFASLRQAQGGLSQGEMRGVRRWVAGTVAPAGIGVALAVGSFWLLQLALTEGPLWSRNYGLYGMQYGAKQLFVEAIPQLLARAPETRVVVSHTWANGADSFIPFFLSPEERGRVQVGTVNTFMERQRELDERMILVMTKPEYDQAVASPKFKSVTVERVVPYPDGSPGFLIGRLAYADGVSAIFAAEREERARPVEAQVTVDGEPVRMRYSRFDMGRPEDLFDGERRTLGRVMEANPAVIELTFPQPRPIGGLAADFGSHDLAIRVELRFPGTGSAVYDGTYVNQPRDPHIEMPFDRGPHVVSQVRLVIRDLRAGDNAKIHIRELAFL